MKTNKKTSVYSIMVIVITALLMTTVVGTDDIYAASKQSKVKSHRKAIKSYNNKTKNIAKKTEAANKYAKKTSGYYKKAKKTKSLKKLKNLRSKAKSSYNTAKCLDYKRQVKDVYKEIKKISDKAPSMDTFVSQALSTYNKANKSKSVSTLKSYLSSINSLYKNVKSHKATLTWYDAEYRSEYVEGHYETIIVQEAEYKLMNVSYYVAMASSKGYRTGTVYDYDLKKCIENGSVFPYSADPADMKKWGCIWYIDGNNKFHDIIPITESTEYKKTVLIPQGLSTQSRETIEWFQTKEEITQQKWVSPHYKTILVRDAGWY